MTQSIADSPTPPAASDTSLMTAIQAVGKSIVAPIDQPDRETHSSAQSPHPLPIAKAEANADSAEPVSLSTLPTSVPTVTPEIAAIDSRPSEHRLRSLAVVTVGLLSLLTLGLAWEFVVRHELLSPGVVSSPSAIWRAAAKLYRAEVLTEDLVASADAFGYGFAIALAIGAGLGSLMRRSSLCDAVMLPFVLLLDAMPRVALAPFFAYEFGPDRTAEIVTIAACAVLPLIMSTRAVRHATTTAPSRTRAATLVRGVRHAFAQGLAGLIVSEIYAATVGVGFLITVASSQNQIDRVMLGLAIITFISLIVSGLLYAIERALERHAATTQQLELAISLAAEAK